MLTAAGSGSRLGSAVPKALVPLAGESLLARAHGRLVAAGITRVVVTHPAGQEGAFAAALGLDAAAYAGGRTSLVPGGATRQESVARALAEVTEEYVLVHDAARPLASADLVRRVLAALTAGATSVVPGLPVVDTIKRVGTGASGPERPAHVVATVPRADLRAVQTPQGFRADVLRAAHAAGRARGLAETSAASDDAALVEEFTSEATVVVPGEEQAMKITTGKDLRIAETLLSEGYWS